MSSGTIEGLFSLLCFCSSALRPDSTLLQTQKTARKPASQSDASPARYKIYYVKEESRVTTSAWIPFLGPIGSLHPSGGAAQPGKGSAGPQEEGTADHNLHFHEVISDPCRCQRGKDRILMGKEGGPMAEVCRTRPLKAPVGPGGRLPSFTLCLLSLYFS